MAKRKLELLENTSDAAIPLEAKPRTAQLDFGEAGFYEIYEHEDIYEFMLEYQELEGE